MSSGSFLDSLGSFDLAGLLDQLRQTPQGFDPQAAMPAPTAGLSPFLPPVQPVRGAGDTTPSGHETGSIDQRRPSIAINEDQAQALERAQAGPQDLAALGPLRGSPDALLFDRSAMGSGANPFTGTSGSTMPDAYASRPTPLPPSRPSDADLMSSPTVTGSVQPRPGPAARSNATPAAPVSPDATGNPASSNLQPVNSFDPLTGQPVSGSPKLMQAPGTGGPTEGAGRVAAQAGAPQVASQPGALMQKFAAGLNNPDFSNLLLNIGIGLLTNRGIGAGIGAGLQGYQQSRMGDVKQQLQQYQLMQQIQGQNATRAYLKGKGLSPAAVEAATLNPSLLSQINKDPQQFTVGGKVYLGHPDQPMSSWQELGSSSGPPSGYAPNQAGGLNYIPGGPEDPEVKAKLAAAGRDGSYTLSPGQTRFDEEGKPVTSIPAAPRELRPGATLYDTTTLKPIVSAPAAKPDGFDTETKLRSEFAKGLGGFNDVHDGYGRVIAATKQRQENPSAVSPASDINLIFGYMKMLDPGSVVREGEYATAKNAAGVPERVLNAYNKAINGEFLTDRQRQDFLGQASELYGTARKTAEGVAERYRGLATQYGVDPGRAVYLPDVPTAPKLGQQSQAPQSGGAAARYQALIQGGMSKADAFAQMHREGL